MKIKSVINNFDSTFVASEDAAVQTRGIFKVWPKDVKKLLKPAPPGHLRQSLNHRKASVQMAGLGWIAGSTSVLLPGDPALKVPHMGWNTATPTGTSKTFDVWGKPQDAYFVHSFAYRPTNDADVAAWCTYGKDRFAAAVCKDNMLGLQFHPEKSQRAGLMLLESWLKS